MSNDKAIVVCKRQVVDFVGLTHGHSAIEMTTYVAGSPLASIALHPAQARELIQELTWRIEEIEKGAPESCGREKTLWIARDAIKPDKTGGTWLYAARPQMGPFGNYVNMSTRHGGTRLCEYVESLVLGSRKLKPGQLVRVRIVIEDIG